MKLTITIDMNNAAFEDDPEELLRILKTVPAKVEEQRLRHADCVCDALEAGDKLLDINGNAVGTIKLKNME